MITLTWDHKCNPSKTLQSPQQADTSQSWGEWAEIGEVRVARTQTCWWVAAEHLQGEERQMELECVVEEHLQGKNWENWLRLVRLTSLDCFASVCHHWANILAAGELGQKWNKAKGQDEDALPQILAFSCYLLLGLKTKIIFPIQIGPQNKYLAKYWITYIDG